MLRPTALPYARTITARVSLLALFVALLLAATGPLLAQDRATLQLLVNRGVITQAEADTVAKQAAIAVVPRSAAVRQLELEGLVQVQYDFLNTSDQAAGAIQPPATSQFLIRRAHLGALANLGHGWTGEVVLELATSAQTSAPPQSMPTTNNFEKIILSKTFPAYGTATAGMQKVAWGEEQTAANSQLKTIERSIATNYFDGVYGGPTTAALGFGKQHTGLFWSGAPPLTSGFYYGAAITNGIQSAVSYGNVAPGAPAFNQFAFWANAGYQGVYRGLVYRLGVNLGYAGDANSTPTQNNSLAGYDPYISLVWADFTLTAEFEQVHVQNGRVNGAGVTSAAAPYGFNFVPAYRLSPEWELVARDSFLSTNGRGAPINPEVRNAQNTFNTLGFDNAWSLYFGVNYYVLGTALKISAGYEFSRFYDREVLAGGSFSGAPASVSGVRVQIQSRF
jgi:hypothetical protein